MGTTSRVDVAVRRDTLNELRDQRVALDGVVDQVAKDLTVAWERAWQAAAGEWEAASLVLALTRDDGKWPTRTQIARERRAQQAMAVTRALLEDYAQGVTNLSARTAEEAVQAAMAGRAGLVATQLPGSVRADITGRFNAVNPAQVAAIVERITQRITATTVPLTEESARAVYQQLTRAPLTGDGPRDVARQMVQQVQGAFSGGLTRALVISRTEILDSHRAAGQAWDRANTAVVEGWQWMCALDRRSCPACWSKHGSRYGPETPGPLDHQQGRCSRLPISRSWAELGYAGREPASLVKSGRQEYDALPEADRVAVMGARRAELLASGRVEWDALAVRRSTSGWRDSFAPKPLRELEAA
ncbi:MAG: hypothetical protein ACRCZP_10180 [Phycicoccus sp.]